MYVDEEVMHQVMNGLDASLDPENQEFPGK